MSDTCPRCGERMVPVLVQDAPHNLEHLPAEPPVRLTCPSCGPVGEVG